MAGTPTKRLARRVSIASSTRTGLKRGRNHTGTPAHAMPSATANPMMWAIGRLTTAVSWRMPAGSSVPAITPLSRPLWVSSTPLGLPVVPDV